MRKGLLTIWLSLIFLTVFTLFWYHAWLYELPTPVPANYKAVNTGSKIQLPASLKVDNRKPILLHFFNPDCPCSRFNREHFKSLVKQYGTVVNFVVVPVIKRPYSAIQIQQKLGEQLPVLFDTALAAKCGVYSTPQAVILDAGHTLYYRGNYNKSRYCSDEKTSYARMALENLLHNAQNPIYNPFALKAYGCGLPNCTKNEE